MAELIRFGPRRKLGWVPAFSGALQRGATAQIAVNLGNESQWIQRCVRLRI